MGVLLKFFLLLIVSLLSFLPVSGGFFDDFINSGAPEIRYCQGDECGLQQGIDVVKGGITDLETERTASQYIQDVMIYLLTFISIIAVIYIIYAGFQILIGNGDEEKVKKSKQTIIYVIIGIIIIWLAWPITRLILNVIQG